MGMAASAAEMQQSSGGREPGELGYGGWILFWAALGLLAIVAMLGAFFASADLDPGDYACGLILLFAAIALSFLLVKSRFDGPGAGWGGFLLVDDMPNLVAVIVVFAALALAGVVIAAKVQQGGLHSAGIALFAISALWVLLSLKHVFDIIDRGH